MAATENDVFSESHTPEIVDCDVLEASKENVQPLASGRRVTALSSILATPHAHREAKLSATRNRLRVNVQIAMEDEEDDPLDAYSRLVAWTVENYPQGHSAESGLLELLEEATRVLKDDRGGKWRRELKYLKLWVLYASFVERPSVIYKFLMANDIGTSHALLYEEHAAGLERDGSRSDADAVYLLGLARNAEPLDRLKSKHREFQKRMMSAAPLPTPAPTPSALTSRRTALATTSGPSTPSPVLQASSGPIPNNRLQVFVDTPGSASVGEPETNAWADFGTRKSRVKENVPEVKKLGGSTLRQPGRTKRIASGPIKSTIVPFRDEPTESVSSSNSAPAVTKAALSIATDDEPEKDASFVPVVSKFTPFRDEGSTEPLPPLALPSDTVIKVKKSALTQSESEALRKDPLKNYGVVDE